MEPSATLAEWRGDTLEVHDATQWTYGVRYGLSAVFGIKRPGAIFRMTLPRWVSIDTLV
jgi:CO/xanthine dehydrogenase Mo-binding subunit